MQPSLFQAQGVFPINEFLLSEELISSVDEGINSSHLAPLVENRVALGAEDKEYELSHYSVSVSGGALTIQATVWRRGEIQVTKTLRVSVMGDLVEFCVQTQVPDKNPLTIMSTMMKKSEVRRPADLIRW
ncbi:hypothetical protein [Shimazuella kribbensis]|uniref:hypothetical protein n=1 Tax=Shimazuella kribbensis TaxID=139808 RepID=UPI00048CFDD2|nr:hypothetical protein [Shimazuella kribbensis]